MQVEGYFMTKESEDAAKWQMFQSYKDLKARYSLLTQQAANMGDKLQRLGSYLKSSPTDLSAPDERIISMSHRTGDPGRAFCAVEEVGFPKIVSLLQDIEKTSSELKSVQERLKSAGMEV